MYTSGTTGRAEGRRAHARLGAVGVLHGRAHRRHPLSRPLRDRAAALPRRRAHAADRQRPARHDVDPHARLRPGAAVRDDRGGARDRAAGRPGDAELHAAGARPRQVRLLEPALDHERRGARAGDVDRELRQARHRGAPGVRAHRELRPRVPHQPGGRDRQGRLDRQGVLPHRRPRRRRRTAATSPPAARRRGAGARPRTS